LTLVSGKGGGCPGNLKSVPTPDSTADTTIDLDDPKRQPAISEERLFDFSKAAARRYIETGEIFTNLTRFRLSRDLLPCPSLGRS